jgi:hypothetical protein
MSAAYNTYGKKYPYKKYVGIAHSAGEELNIATCGMVLKKRTNPLSAELKEMLRRLLDGEATEESYKEMLRRLLRGDATEEQYAALIQTRSSKAALKDEEEKLKASMPLPEVAASDTAQQRIQYQYIGKLEADEAKNTQE